MAQVFANPLQMIGWNLKYHNEPQNTSFHIELKLPDFKPFFCLYKWQGGQYYNSYYLREALNLSIWSYENLPQGSPGRCFPENDTALPIAGGVSVSSKFRQQDLING